jgi:hypothetical protein
VSDQVLYPYKKTGKIIALYILIFKFLGRKLEEKILQRMIASISWLHCAPNFFLNRILIVKVVPNIWTFRLLQRTYCKTKISANFWNSQNLNL